MLDESDLLSATQAMVMAPLQSAPQLSFTLDPPGLLVHQQAP